MVLLHLEEQPPIVQAIFAGVLEEIKELIDHKQNVNELDCEKRTPLHAAAYKGDTVIASVLLENGARVNAKDSKWITPLHRACSNGFDDTVALLLSYQADVSARDKLWQTPLHIAAANDSYNCVDQLLNYVPNLNVTDRAGRTALHHAAINGHTYVVELLISRGCIVNACDKKDVRPLHCAVQMGHIETAEILIKSGADVNAKDRNLYTPLHVAAAAGKTCHKFDNCISYDSISRMLISFEAEVDSQNAYGNTPAHIACLNGHLSVLQDLAEAGADLEALNFRGQTPLHIAAASAHGVDCLTYLLSQNVDVNKQSADGRTPLHMTAIHGRFTRSKPLIDKGALIDCADKNGCTPLHIAAQHGHDLLANTLLSYGADPSKKGYEGRTPLHMCCLSGYVECCRKFLQASVDLNVRDDKGMAPIHCAAYKGSIECLDLLVSNKADITLLDHLRRLPVHYAASQGHYQCVFTLVGIGSPVCAADAQGCTPLHLAAGYDLEGKCVEYLLSHRADANETDVRGLLPLHYAIAGGNEAATRSLAIPNGQTVGKETTAVTTLHLAAKVGPLALVKPLLSFFREFDIQTKEGVTPLMLAAREGHSQIVQFMLRFGAKVSIRDKNNWSAIHYSAKNGHAHCLSMMVNNSDDPGVVNSLDGQHRTALMLAVSGNHIECVKILLKAGADPNIVDTDDHSCLFRAVVNGQNSVVQLLLSNKANVSNTDVNGKTVLHLAAACGHFTCLQLILNYMTDEEARAFDNQQCTVLHWACYNGHANCVEYLLDKEIFKSIEGNSFSPVHCATFSGSERCLELLVGKFGQEVVNLTDCRQRTPLHIACLHGHAECAKFLLEQGAEVQVRDEEGRTPFIAAAQYGQSHVIELLLATKVSRTACDNDDNTALHLACLKRHSQTALLILDDPEVEPAINMLNREKKTPLHISARNGLVEVTRVLLKRGASVLAVDNDGLTPALCCAPSNNVAQCLALILRTLPEFIEKHPLENDPLLLLPFYTCLLNTASAKIFTSQNSQTTITMVAEPDNFEIKHFFGLKKSKYKRQFQESRNKKLVLANDSYYLVEGDDFRENASTKCDALGLNLHKSLSDICIISNYKEFEKKTNVKQLHDLSDKKKNCYKCRVLQHRCPDCTIRHVLRQHLQGKTSQRDFKDFVTKTLTETSSDYRKKFSEAVDAVGIEFGLTGTKPKMSKFNIMRGKADKKFLSSKSDPINRYKACHSNFTPRSDPNKHETDNKLFSDDYMREIMDKQLEQLSRTHAGFCDQEAIEEIVPCLKLDELHANEGAITYREADCEDTRQDKDLVKIEDDQCNININEEFLKYLRSIPVGRNKTHDQEYFFALSCYMNKMLKKFDNYFTTEKEKELPELEGNFDEEVDKSKEESENLKEEDESFNISTDEDDEKIAEYLGVIKKSQFKKKRSQFGIKLPINRDAHTFYCEVSNTHVESQNFKLKSLKLETVTEKNIFHILYHGDQKFEQDLEEVTSDCFVVEEQVEQDEINEDSVKDVEEEDTEALLVTEEQELIDINDDFNICEGESSNLLAKKKIKLKDSSCVLS